MFNFIEFANSCSKGLLIILNLLCMLLALVTFGFAVVDIRILKQYEGHASGCYTGDLIIIVACLLLVAVAIVGCLGAARDSVKLLNLYVGFVLILVILELMISIYVGVQRFGLQFRVTEWIREDFYRNVTLMDMEDHRLTWDNIQTTYECCGLNNPKDYTALGKRIPIACCSRAFTAKTDNARKLMYKSCIENAAYYEDGCEDVILDTLQSDADYLLGVAVVSFWFEASGILLAMWVSKHLRNSVQVYKNTVRY